jgi:uncharacterized protein YlzI (FlbEa/FlbD family)
MITLHNAVVPFDGDEIVVDASTVVDVSVDHTLANSDCTRVALSNGDVFQVQESVEEVEALIEGDKETNGGN